MTWEEHWNDVRTFKQAQKAMIDFLRGVYIGNPWFDDLSPETDAIREVLIAINKKGMITLSSQPRMLTVENIEQTIQREYVSGFVLTDKFETFRRKLERHGGINVYAERLDACYVSPLAERSLKELTDSRSAIPLTWIQNGQSIVHETNFWLPHTAGQYELAALKNKIEQGKVQVSFMKRLKQAATYVHLSAFDIHSSILDVVRESLS